MNKKKISFLIGGAAGVLFVGVLLFLLREGVGTTSSVVAQPPVQQNTITVQGEGKVYVEPDIAHLHLGVEKTSNSAEHAQEQVNKAIVHVREALASFDIEAENIQTISIGVHPEYQHGEKGEQVEMYRARHILKVEYDEIGHVGEVIDRAVSAGANRVEHIRFALKDQTESEQQALHEAIESTQAKAEAMAKSAGKKKGDILHIVEQGVQVDFPVESFSPEMAERGFVHRTAVEAGEIEIVQRVNVVYELKK